MLLPVLIGVIPALTSSGIADEAFHKWMVFIAVPVSAYALLKGHGQHRRWAITGQGLIGLLILAVSAFLGEEMVGEEGERYATLTGALMIAVSHYRNYRSCRGQSKEQVIAPS